MTGNLETYRLEITHDADNQYHVKRKHRHHIVDVFERPTGERFVQWFESGNPDYARVVKGGLMLPKWKHMLYNRREDDRLNRRANDWVNRLKNGAVFGGNVTGETGTEKTGNEMRIKPVQGRARFRGTVRQQPLPNLINTEPNGLYSPEWWLQNIQGATLEHAESYKKDRPFPDLISTRVLGYGVTHLLFRHDVVQVDLATDIGDLVVVTTDDEYMFTCECGRKTDWLPAGIVFEVFDRLKAAGEHSVNFETVATAVKRLV